MGPIPYPDLDKLKWVFYLAIVGALGRWFINEGKRIGREYKSNGAPKGEQE